MQTIMAAASSCRLVVFFLLAFAGFCYSQDSDAAGLVEVVEDISEHVTGIADSLSSAILQFIDLKQNFKPLKGLLQCDYDWHKAVAVKGMPTCYFFSKFETTWARSRDICTSMNAHLATVDDSFEWSFLEDLVTGSEAWIGLRDEKGGESFRWVEDNSVLTGDRDYWWAEGEPNNAGPRCIHYSADRYAKWMDDDCNKELRFVCEKPAVLTVNEI